MADLPPIVTLPKWVQLRYKKRYESNLLHFSDPRNLVGDERLREAATLAGERRSAIVRVVSREEAHQHAVKEYNKSLAKAESKRRQTSMWDKKDYPAQKGKPLGMGH